ncbi:pleckstrin homology domain-containing family S member 1 [Sorex fumeus]|uniref:pleckstrin homology domain-containing family S member 1 n=1 Tax=Sorex fumeus TaxID=62283 RepID=UPI0024AC8A1B|nr:pleckstrin homology domain-containing family S member 1 [Sorex fumeus]
MEHSPLKSPGKQFAFYNENEVCKQDFFIKSPPPGLLTSLTSWKKRFFVLSKNGSNSYSLSYYKDHHHRGVIEIDGNSIIEVGISNEEKLQSVQKMFHCQPEEVMSIRTTKRDYFLINHDREKIKEWVSFMSTVSRWELKAAVQNTEEFSMDNYRCLSAPLSPPSPLNSTDSAKFYSYRSGLPGKHVTGGPPESRQDYPIYEFLSKTDQDNEEENYYSIPRNIPLEVDKIHAENDIDKSINPDSPEILRRLEPIYMSMKSCFSQDEARQSAGSQEETQSLPETRPEPSHPQEEGSGRDVHLCPPSPEAETKGPAPPTVVQLSILINNITDESKVEKLNVYLSIADISNCLSFVEAAGQICVAQWEGPAHLGCIFFHGDHLLAVNDLVPRSLEEVSLFLSRCVQKAKVKLTIGRIQNSEKFHAQSCTCPQKYKAAVSLELDAPRLPRIPRRNPAIRKGSNKEADS